MTEREQVTIYTLAWEGDHAVGSAEANRLQHLAQNGADEYDEPQETAATVYCVVELNGQRIYSAVSATPRYSSDFTTVLLELAPASVKIVECDAAEWDSLTKERVA